MGDTTTIDGETYRTTTIDGRRVVQRRVTPRFTAYATMGKKPSRAFWRMVPPGGETERRVLVALDLLEDA